MSLPTVEEVQSVILQSLAASPDGTIADSRTLKAGATSLAGPEGQAVIKAALDSLTSKEVGRLEIRRRWHVIVLLEPLC